jgi:ribosome biogenesis GTPase
MAPTDDPGLAVLGWRPFFAGQLDAWEGPALRPMRVSIEHQDRFTVVDGNESFDARLTGLRLQDANTGGMRPAVGDWIGVNDSGAIAHVFDRQTAFRRRNQRGREQVIAANIDVVFLVSSCNLEFNARRIERYLAAIAESGAEPVVVLSKTDLCDDVERYVEETRPIAGDALIVPTSTPLVQGLDQLAGCLAKGRTVALVGSSGVGKSTLANALLGVELFETAPIRESDAKGRHTTTRRELVVLDDDRGILIDTPGMRELALYGEGDGLDVAFADIIELAAQCRFRNCEHKREPGCAVRGKVPPRRLASYQRLLAEGSRTAASQRRSKP